MKVPSKKRALDEVAEDEPKHIKQESLKKSKTNTREEEKGAAQSNLAGFLGVSLDPSAKFKGSAKYENFPSPDIDIWHWNINGLNATIERGDLQKFMK